MADAQDVMDTDVCLIFLVWMLLSSMIETPSHRSRARAILSLYEEESVSLWAVPLFMTLGCWQSSKFDRLRMWYKDPRQETQWRFIENMAWHTTPEMRDNKYQEIYRMPYSAMEELVEELRPFLESHQEELLHDQVDIRKIVHMVVYRLAHGIGYRHIADRYGMGSSTVWKYVQIVVTILSDATRYPIYDKYICNPTGERLQNIINRFQGKTGLPNICGAIDGTHIPLAHRASTKVTLAHSDYFNRKKRNSIVVQAVCDADKIFWNVCAGCPGGVHDGGQFKTSSLYQQLRRQEILQHPQIIVRELTIKPYLVGDSAYPIRTYLMKNYKSKDAADVYYEEKKRFDKSMNRGRVVIEHAFGALKGRWKILTNFPDEVDKAAAETLACCVLHNFCKMRRLPLPPSTTGEGNSDMFMGFNNHVPHLVDGRAAKDAGMIMRDVLFGEWRSSNPPLSPSE